MTVYVTEAPDFALVAEGDPMEMVGAVLSSTNVVEGPALNDELPEASVAVPEAIEIPIVPSPEHDDKVTVRVEVPAPLTAAEHVAVPEVLTVISPLASVTAEAPV